ncbi:hypothetical protein EYB25_008427 [Talaromyces marneffei]|nr:hypothetical protein EYB25_008427 [Talaromyces marneffei]
MCAIFSFCPSSLGGAPYKNLPFRQKLTSLGLKSALILASTLVCLILALQWGGSVYPWSDSRVWGCFLGFGLLLALFGYMQYHQKDEYVIAASTPTNAGLNLIRSQCLVPLRVLSQRSVLLGCIFSCLLQGAMMTQTYYLPFYFQAVRGTDAQTSGFSILPYGVTISIATLISGTLVTLSGFYVPFMWVGSGIFVAGSGLLYTLSRSSPFAKWFGYQVVLAAADIPLGSTLVILAQCLGGSIGLAIAENVFRNALHTHLLALQGVDVPAVEAAGGAELQNVVPVELLGPVRDAFRVAVSDAFLVAVGLGGVAFLAFVGMERKRIIAKGG